MNSKYNRNHEFNYQFNRFVNHFRFVEQQQNSYNNRFVDESFSQKNYDNDFDNVYTFVDNQQQSSRQTQYFIIYQINNFNYQNRVYQNQSNYRQNSSSIETNQSYVKNQSFSQKQSYRLIEFMFFNTYQQSKNAFDLQFKSLQQSYRFDNVYSNQYQNRSSYNQQSYDQRLNSTQQNQRAYLIENNQKKNV